MAKLIFKCPYIKSGSKNSHKSNLVKYISTRDGVQKVSFDKKENYVGYIANRPKVEKLSTHGLFNGQNGEINLQAVTKEITKHKGNVWLPIISLKREDAERVDFCNADAWKDIISANILDIAKAMKIHPDNFKWYAAYHDDEKHPHIHMMCYSTDSKEGYLTKKGIEKIKSKLTNEIFKQELTSLYREKTMRRNELKEQSKVALEKLKNAKASPKIENLLNELKVKLAETGGKEVYGYLKPSLKDLVNKIVDELENIDEVKACYNLWRETQEEIIQNYSDKELEKLPLSQQKEFNSIKNMIIREVLSDDVIAENNMAENFAPSALGIFKNIFKLFENKLPCEQSQDIKIDSKLIQKMRERKLAMGQKLDVKGLKL